MSDELDEVVDGYCGQDEIEEPGSLEEPADCVEVTRTTEELPVVEPPTKEPEPEEQEGKKPHPVVQEPTLHDSGTCTPVPTTTAIVNAMGNAEAQAAANLPEASEIRKALANPAVNDRLVEEVRKDSSTLTLLNTVMEEIAEEAAYLKAWRNAVWNGETDISDATMTRIKMLKSLVDTLVEREKMKREKSVGRVDFHSDNFQNVLRFFMATILKTFKKVKVPPQYEDIFFTQLAQDFDGFEKKAERLYYGKK